MPKPTQHSHDHAHSHHGHNHHVHGKTGHSCPTHGADERRLLWAAALTGSFMIAEIAGGYISGSLALIADAGHMSTDFAAMIAAFIGVRLARTANSQRARRIPAYIALGSGLSLYLIAGWICYEAYQRLSAPTDVLGGPMLVVAVLGLLVNIIVFKILIGGDRTNLNMRGAMLHVIGDILGSVAAILAAIIIVTTGYMLADPILSVLVALLIVVSAAPLIRDSFKAIKSKT